MKALLIGGAMSGAGKTSVTLALLHACRRQGLRVQPFKTGPDFIDPGHHARAAGRPSHNLDGWMLGEAECRHVFARHAAGADLAVVEGVMGLYDGFSGLSEEGSSAQLAKLLDLPVLLVIPARSVARSFAALAQGFLRFDPGVRWAGVLANQVGSANHLDYLRQAMTLVPEAPFLGGLGRRTELNLPERHLGLVTDEDGQLGPARLDLLADWLEEALDLEALLDSLPEFGLTPLTDPAPAGEPVTVAVARDRAFCFYYGENLRRLEAAGARLAFFSPLADEPLPAGARGLYLGGGYPELHAPALSAARRAAQSIAAAGRAGMPIYAECGGMMYLGRELGDLEGRTWPMLGLLPLATRMLTRRRALGYREVEFTASTVLGGPGLVARGHEFHYSEVTGAAPEGSAWTVRDRRGQAHELPGYAVGNILASYLHLHFGSQPALATHFVEACRRWSGGTA